MKIHICFVNLSYENFYPVFDISNFFQLTAIADQNSISLDDFKEILKINGVKRVKLLNGLISDQKNKTRDIYRVKRVAFFSNLQLKNQIDNLILEYPRTELVNDKNGVLINVLQKNSKMDMFQENPIFIIDPYGRAVMYFEPSTDPKKILKDLKVLI